MRTRAALVSLGLVLVLAPSAMATFPGRNGLLAVAADTDSSSDTIYVGRLGGGGLRALPSPCPPGPPDPAWDTCSVGAPAWSPDGARLAFTSIRGSTPQTWIVNADGSDLHQVPTAAGFSPAWSPDGTRLAFSVDAWDNQECHFRDLYTVNVDGSDLSLVTHHGDNPDWSVRGQIVYERLREYWTSGDGAECEPQTSIAVMRPGEKPRRVASGAGPHWAPGGHTIAYLSRGGLRRKRIGTDGPGRVLRTPGGYELAWSPDGRFIVFRRSLRLRLIGSHHGHRLPIGFDAPGIDFSADWQPLPR
jgi:dipeptidyl aminopeptidase/acylaminoacyl peptidase